jgi:hypothetical protein
MELYHRGSVSGRRLVVSSAQKRNLEESHGRCNPLLERATANGTSQNVNRMRKSVDRPASAQGQTLDKKSPFVEASLRVPQSFPNTTDKDPV